MQTFSNISILQAKMQAWCVAMLSVLNDAHELGAVIGKGGAIKTPSDTLYPDVMFVPKAMRAHVKPDAIHAAIRPDTAPKPGAPALAIDMIFGALPAKERGEMCARYAKAGVLEYWQIEVDRGEAKFFQANAAWTYDLVPPDKNGIHYAVAMDELVFPAAWFKQQPGIMKMMEFWGFIEPENQRD